MSGGQQSGSGVVPLECQQRPDFFYLRHPQQVAFVLMRFTLWPQSECFISSIASIFQSGRRGRTKGKRLKSQSPHVFPVFKELIQKPHLATSACISSPGLYHTTIPNCCSTQNKGSIRREKRMTRHCLYSHYCLLRRPQCLLTHLPASTDFLNPLYTLLSNQSSWDLAPNSSLF